MNEKMRMRGEEERQIDREIVRKKDRKNTNIIRDCYNFGHIHIFINSFA